MEEVVKIAGLTLGDWGFIIAFISFISGVFGWIMRKVVIDPLRSDIINLSEDIKGFNSSRKENESKLFGIADDHTKEIAHLQGAVNTLAVTQQSNTMRLDRVENRIDKGERT